MLGYSIAIGIVAIMLGIGGIAYGLGYSLDDRRLKAFGRDEILQSLVNGVIVGSLFLFFSPGGLGVSIVNSLVSGSGAGASCQGLMSSNYAICFAHNYLVGIAPVSMGGRQYPSLLEDTLGLLVPTSAAYVTLGLIASVRLGVGVASVSLSAVLTPLLSQAGFIITALTMALMSIYVQSALLGVVAAVAMPLLLPVGIVLRTFYPTRRLGGAVIAIAVGLFTVFPLSYLLDAQITSSYSYGLNQTMLGSFSIQAGSLKDSITGQGSSGQPSNGIIQSLLSGASQLSSSFEGVLNLMVDEVAMLVVQVFFFPVFSVILTVTSIRELARVLGSEVSLGKFDIF